MAKIAIAYRYLPDYRMQFFEELHKQAAATDHSLDVYYGDPHGTDKAKNDQRDLAWGNFVPNRRLILGRQVLTYQPVLKQVADHDLVIVEQANRLLINPLLLAGRAVKTRRKVAFWGHGRNRQAQNPDSPSERLKRKLLTLPDWWFGYTDETREYLASKGVPPERISVLKNSTDVARLRHDLAGLDPSALREFRARHDLAAGRTACYLGGLYSDKRISHLIQAADLTSELVPGFRLVVCGDGPDRAMLEEAARSRAHIVYLGSVFGPDRAVVYAASSASVMTGMVGLPVVDAFAAGLPVVACDLPNHSPEIAYLTHDESGLVVEPNDPAAVAKALSRLMTDGTLHSRLSAGAVKAADGLGVERMAANMWEGIERCVGS